VYLECMCMYVCVCVSACVCVPMFSSSRALSCPDRKDTCVFRMYVGVYACVGMYTYIHAYMLHA
jgi:hypothetical protein